MSEFDARFSGVLGQDYDLFAKSISYHNEFQETVGQQIKRYVQEKDLANPLFLEAGIGTGLTTIRVLEASESAKIVGVDNEPVTLDQARKILSDLKNRVTFIESDIFTFLKNEPSEKYDGFFSAYVIHNLPPDYRRKLIPEIARVLKKDGLYINADKIAWDDEKKHMKSLQDQIKAFEVYEQLGKEEVRSEWVAHYLEDDKIRLTEAEHQTLLNAADFLRIEQVFRNGMDAIFIARKR